MTLKILSNLKILHLLSMLGRYLPYLVCRYVYIIHMVYIGHLVSDMSTSRAVLPADVLLEGRAQGCQDQGGQTRHHHPESAVGALRL